MGVQQHDGLSEDNERAGDACVSSSVNQKGPVSVSDVSNPSAATESGAVNEPGGVSCKKSNTPHFYRQDVVRNTTSGLIGIVTEVAGDSDSDSSITDDEDDSEDEDADSEEENADDSNNASRNCDQNSADGDFKTGALLADQMRVLWINETESTQNFNDVEVVDRGFLHGDFVAAASDPTGQVGVVVDVNISVDLLAPGGSIIKDISSKSLKRIRDFTIGDYVVLGPWLGRIDDVLDNVTVLFDDGSVCKLTKADPLDLQPVSKNILEDGHFLYYPGQRVRASSSSVFKNSRWLSGLWKANRLEGTVSNVTVGSVFVRWISSAGYGPYSSSSPAEEQSPKNLKLLSCFAHANWQLGDWCLLPSPALSSSISLDKGISKLELNVSVTNELDSNQKGSVCDSEEVTAEELNGNEDPTDLDPVDALEGNDGNVGSNPSRDSSSCGSSSISVSKDPVHETWPLHRKKIRKVVIRKERRAQKKEESFEKALLIVKTRTKVDVAWQDGVLERERDSTSLIPIDNLGDHEFVSEQYVVEKTSDDGLDISETRRVGVVRSVNAKERTAFVRWLKPVDRAEDPREFDKEEVVSVYELEGHPDYDYCYGDVVVRLSPVSVSLETASVEESIEKSMQKNEERRIKKETKSRTGTGKVEIASGGEACKEYSDPYWVGNITGLTNGDIEVTWADGMVSTVGPQAIYVVGRDDDESIVAGSQISDAASWETVNDDEMEVLEETREDILRENSSSITSASEESGENGFGRSAALAVPLAAFRFVTRLATGIFSRGQRNLDVVHLQPKDESELPSRDESSSQKCVATVGENSGNKSGRNEEVVPETSEILEACEALCTLRNKDAPASYDDDACSFKHFDITKDPLDHYFTGTNGQSNNRKWFKKVQQDWTILQNNLPEEIYVRVYEDRMDLLRAVIVGPYGTPYQDGLFFFDFHLPPEYPDVPPSAYYHSGGWRINPNLYEEGKVCLSLLNTWTGRGNEIWDPKSSSILQVLVSLQGLVLNSKPYFNEAGYDKQIGTAEGEKNSLSYNENAFLLNCKTMMYLIRKPPKDFEVLIKEHFRRRGHNILKACDAYMKGYLIGTLTRDASVSDKSTQNSTSVGFKLMLAKIVQKLYLSLNELGADCEEFRHLQGL
ncbi:hypothetical protein TanjilG_30496 [Lupinus angustifolius]|uniref:E2 ubiquitin-conjugating enzyme n=1 Tax=Lupinus angustifolius TaxID=3871 RepID=A0A394DDU5_LUPAN|nr:PREDICTED: probable ubiquitin-conjugating enzyme E2 23 [Lupinus angustifolius]OIW21173.1 hypothetical protein TanjilG_30496 [Lupinus angustifolius]